MKVQILDAAKEDLVEGFGFYESSERGIGGYFLACLYSDIESLRVFGGIHRRDSSQGLQESSPVPVQAVPIRHLLHR